MSNLLTVRLTLTASPQLFSVCSNICQTGETVAMTTGTREKASLLHYDDAAAAALVQPPLQVNVRIVQSKRSDNSSLSCPPPLPAAAGTIKPFSPPAELLHYSAVLSSKRTSVMRKQLWPQSCLHVSQRHGVWTCRIRI